MDNRILKIFLILILIGCHLNGSNDVGGGPKKSEELSATEAKRYFAGRVKELLRAFVIEWRKSTDLLDEAANLDPELRLKRGGPPEIIEEIAHTIARVEAKIPKIEEHLWIFSSRGKKLVDLRFSLHHLREKLSELKKMHSHITFLSEKFSLLYIERIQGRIVQEISKASRFNKHPLQLLFKFIEGLKSWHNNGMQALSRKIEEMKQPWGEEGEMRAGRAYEPPVYKVQEPQPFWHRFRRKGKPQREERKTEPEGREEVLLQDITQLLQYCDSILLKSGNIIEKAYNVDYISKLQKEKLRKLIGMMIREKDKLDGYRFEYIFEGFFDRLYNPLSKGLSKLEGIYLHIEFLATRFNFFAEIRNEMADKPVFHSVQRFVKNLEKKYNSRMQAFLRKAEEIRRAKQLKEAKEPLPKPPKPKWKLWPLKKQPPAVVPDIKSLNNEFKKLTSTFRAIRKKYDEHGYSTKELKELPDTLKHVKSLLYDFPVEGVAALKKQISQEDRKIIKKFFPKIRSDLKTLQKKIKQFEKAERRRR